LTTGEVVGINISNIYSDWGNIAGNSGGAYFYLTAEVVDAVTFRIKNSATGNYWNATGYSQPPPSPQLVWHEKCGYEAIVDDFPDPSDSTGKTRIQKNAWIPQASQLYAYSPQFRLEIQPPTQQAEDSFLMVYRPSSNTVSTGPASALINSADFYGAITDGTEIALFAKSATPVRGSAYEVDHSGRATQVISGLLPNTGYRVLQGSTTVGTFQSGGQGAISFSEDGGGTFTIAPLQRSNVGGRAGLNGTIIIK
jgi:hypothetical protein